MTSRIRLAIRRGELKPGVQVRQADWAERLGVSRVPVREALTALASSGLLAHSSRQGYFVAELNEADARQLYRLRNMIDMEIAPTLPWPDDEQLATLRGLCAEVLDAQAERDVFRWIDANESFMMNLYGLSPLTVLVGEAQRLWDRCELYRAHRVISVVTEAQQDIAPVQILRAVEAQDYDQLIAVWSATTDFDRL